MNINNENEQISVKNVIPDEYRSVFPFEKFNEMQSSLFHQIYDVDVNITVAAPTGAGKTVICEIAILRLLNKYSKSDLKCIMITPNKALCQQKMKEWTATFGSLGLHVLELTGDTMFQHSLRLVAKANIIITTPEKWDSMTRSWRQHIFLLGSIDLLIVDEAHHLNEDSRGATLEAVIVRMRILNNSFQEKSPISARLKTPMRIIALSAALPNISDIGEWLKCKPNSIHYFDETYRPVPLIVHTIAYGSTNNMFLFEKSLDNKVEEVIKNNSSGKQTLVFCASKSGCERLSQLLAPRFHCTSGGYCDEINQIQDTKLKELVRRGHGFHHAGIPADDRILIEKLFMQGIVRVLCATSTLAHGVNLPAHLVIIKVKGTNQWRGGSKGYEKMSKSMILQMVGRAGRPGFDTSGVAVIMTSYEDKEYYSNLNLDIVESSLPIILTEIICAEISQSVIKSVDECVIWLKNTFFYTRVKLNPMKYGFSSHLYPSQLEELLIDLCSRSLKDLKAAEIIKYEDSTSTRDAVTIIANPAAHIMTKHMIKLKTMISLMNLSASASIYDIITAVSKTSELEKPVIRSEKKILNELIKQVRYPQKKLKVQEPFHKAYVLLLSAVFKNRFDSYNVTNDQIRVHSILQDFALRVQQSEVVEQCFRLLSALFDYCVEVLKGKIIESCIYLMRALKLQTWENDYHVFDQCKDLPFLVNARLRRENMHDIDDVLSIPSTELQKIVRCSRETLHLIYNFAKQEKCSSLTADFQPSYDENKLMTKFKVIIAARISTTEDRKQYENHFQANRLYHLIVYDNITSKLFCYRKFFSQLDSITFQVTLPPLPPLAINSEFKESICVSLISDDVIGQDFTKDYPPSIDLLESKSIPPKNKFQKNNQTLLPFTTALYPNVTKNKDYVVDNYEHSSISMSSSHNIPQLVDDEQTKQPHCSSGVSSSLRKSSKGNRGKKLSRKKNGDSNMSMFGVFEYKPLRDKEDDKDSSNKQSRNDGIPFANILPECSTRSNILRDLHPSNDKNDMKSTANFHKNIENHPELNLMRSKAFELQLHKTPIQQACKRILELQKTTQHEIVKDTLPLTESQNTAISNENMQQIHYNSQLSNANYSCPSVDANFETSKPSFFSPCFQGPRSQLNRGRNPLIYDVNKLSKLQNLDSIMQTKDSNLVQEGHNLRQNDISEQLNYPTLSNLRKKQKFEFESSMEKMPSINSNVNIYNSKTISNTSTQQIESQDLCLTDNINFDNTTIDLFDKGFF